MRKVKNTIIMIAFVAVVIAAIIIPLYLNWQSKRAWPDRFQAELDDFFGEGNWEWISEETKESSMYTVYDTTNYDYDGYISDKPHPGEYHVWNIAFTNRKGEKEIWVLSDHAMKINHSRQQGLIPSGRYSPKQAFTQQLMELSFVAAEEEIDREILRKLLPEQEADCLKVDISYRNGNPPPEMYDKLMEQPWFSANQVTASDYLASDMYDFYLWIHAYDYKVENLTESERQHLMDSLEELENMLRDTYGGKADYEIYLDEEHKAEFTATEF